MSTTQETSVPVGTGRGQHSLDSVARPDATAGTLRFDNVCKRFGDTVAVDHVSFDVHSGEIVALLGENGAGKSTLIKILAGVYSADSGKITLGGRAPSQDRKAGMFPVAFIHQDLGLIEWMTVAENIGLNGNLGGRWGWISWSGVRERAAEALRRVGGDIDPAERVFNLSRTDKSLVAIARALTTQCAFLVLDEPTSSLPSADVERLFDVLRGLRAQGVGMIYVSHRLDEIPRIAERVAVMRDGQLVGTRDVAHTNTDELVSMIVGRAIANVRKARVPDASAPTMLELRALCVDRSSPVSLSVRAGEIIALTGLKGSGHTAVGRAIFGIDRAVSGRTVIQGRDVVLTSPADAIRHGLGFSSSNRREEGLAMNMTVSENLLFNPGIRGQRLFSPIWPASDRDVSRELIREYDIQPPDHEAIVETLSGGNQQKVVLARWRYCNPQIMILEEPTLGVDVGSKAQIYKILETMLHAGKAIIMVSSDFEEVAQVAHRALIFQRGKVVTELTGQTVTNAHITRAATG